MNAKFLLPAGAIGLLMAGGALAQTNDIRQDNRDVKQDLKERSTLQREARHSHGAARARDRAQAMKETQDINADKRDIRTDRQQYNSDPH